MPNRDRSLLLVNANARRGDIDAEEIADRLSPLGPVVAPPCPDAGALRGAILEHAGAVRRVVICGGDGTLHCALPALLSTGLPLGVLPCGTANDFARSLGIKDVDAGIETVIAGHIQAVDVGVVNGTCFLNAAGVGLGPEINKNLEKAAKRRFGALGYFLQALRQLRGHRGLRLEINCDGERVALRALQVTIANGVHYGGGMTISQDARLDDSRLDVLCIRPQSLPRLLAHGLFLRSGRLADSEHISTFSCHNVTVTTRHAADVTADGELVTRTPADCHVRSRALKVFVPAK